MISMTLRRDHFKPSGQRIWMTPTVQTVETVDHSNMLIRVVGLACLSSRTFLTTICMSLQRSQIFRYFAGDADQR